MIGAVSKLRNTIENLAYVSVTLIVGGFFMYYVMVKPLRQEMHRMTMALIAKDTYSIQNDFQKMKTHKGGTITLDLTNEMNHVELIPMDSVVIDTFKQQGFWRKWFGRKL